MGPLPVARTLPAPPTPAASWLSTLSTRSNPSTALSGLHGRVGKPIVAFCVWRGSVLAGVDPEGLRGPGLNIREGKETRTKLFPPDCSQMWHRFKDLQELPGVMQRAVLPR